MQFAKTKNDQANLTIAKLLLAAQYLFTVREGSSSDVLEGVIDVEGVPYKIRFIRRSSGWNFIIDVQTQLDSGDWTAMFYNMRVAEKHLVEAWDVAEKKARDNDMNNSAMVDAERKRLCKSLLVAVGA